MTEGLQMLRGASVLLAPAVWFCSCTDFHYSQWKRIFLSVIQVWLSLKSSCLIEKKKVSTAWKVSLGMWREKKQNKTL